MIDLHCHLLPGIDDGPDTLEQSLELCRIAAADGITHSVVTPHIHPGRWENNRDSIRGACEQLRRELDQQGIALVLGYGCEVRLTDEVMAQVTQQQLPFLGELDGRRVLLLEFPHGHLIPGSENLVRWLLRHDIQPLIAHPERNKEVMKDLSRLHPLLDAGCWLQVTGGSVMGAFGERAQEVAHQLLEQDLVTVMASDGHNAKARPPVLSAAYQAVAASYGEARARRLVHDTPAAIVAGNKGMN